MVRGLYESRSEGRKQLKLHRILRHRAGPEAVDHMPRESASDDETADELGEGWSVMVLDDDAGFPAGYWLTDTGPGHRRVRGCGSNSLGSLGFFVLVVRCR